MEFQYRVNFSSANQQESALPLLFTARMMVIFLLWIRGMENILPPFLPFIEGLNYLRDQNWLFSLLDWVYWISLVMVFSGIRFRFFSLVIGCLIFYSILASKPQFSNSFLYSGCIFFLIGIFRPGLEWVFRLQIALLYLGAGINKIFDPDWLSGQYFDFFFSVQYRNQLYLNLSHFIPGNGLAIFLSYATILTELGLGAWALIHKRRILLVLLINFFHISMLILTVGELSYIFYFLMAVSSYLILPWTEKKGTEIQFNEKSPLFQFLRSTDSDKFFTWTPIAKEKVQLFEFRKILHLFFLYFGKVIYHKVMYGFCVIILVFVCRYRNHLLNLF